MSQKNCGGGAVAAPSSGLTERRDDARQCFVELLLDELGAAQHAMAEAREQAVPARIRRAAPSMMGPIHLDHEPGRLGHEVGVSNDWLSAKIHGGSGLQLSGAGLHD